MPMPFSLQEGKLKIQKHWNKITHEVKNLDVQREDITNWIEELKVETCVTEGRLCCLDFGMNPEPEMIFYVA